MPGLINRPEYLRQLIENKDIDLVKIITGIRRCGKSSLLDLFHQYLTENHVPDANIIHMNLESLRYRELTDYLKFYDYISARMPKEGKTYLLFDELQAVEHWEKAIESFRLDFDVDIYITGSNAYLLSTEFSTLLSGRYVEIRMLPLSFKEFLCFYEFETAVTMEEKFQKYLQFGGMLMEETESFEREETLLFLISMLVRRFGQPFESSVLPCRREIERACAYMEEHFAERIYLDEICRYAGLGKSALLRAFTKEKGVTPYRYLENVRIGAAKKMLAEGVPPGETAMRTGFLDQSHFTNYFSRFIGLAPGSYRKMFTKKDGG